MVAVGRGGGSGIVFAARGSAGGGPDFGTLATAPGGRGLGGGGRNFVGLAGPCSSTFDRVGTGAPTFIVRRSDSSAPADVGVGSSTRSGVGTGGSGSGGGGIGFSAIAGEGIGVSGEGTAPGPSAGGSTAGRTGSSSGVEGSGLDVGIISETTWGSSSTGGGGTNDGAAATEGAEAVTGTPGAGAGVGASVSDGGGAGSSDRRAASWTCKTDCAGRLVGGTPVRTESARARTR